MEWRGVNAVLRHVARSENVEILQVLDVISGRGSFFRASRGGCLCLRWDGREVSADDLWGLQFFTPINRGEVSGFLLFDRVALVWNVFSDHFYAAHAGAHHHGGSGAGGILGGVFCELFDFSAEHHTGDDHPDDDEQGNAAAANANFRTCA